MTWEAMVRSERWRVRRSVAGNWASISPQGRVVLFSKWRDALEHASACARWHHS